MYSRFRFVSNILSFPSIIGVGKLDGSYKVSSFIYQEITIQAISDHKEALTLCFELQSKVKVEKGINTLTHKGEFYTLPPSWPHEIMSSATTYVWGIGKDLYSVIFGIKVWTLQHVVGIFATIPGRLIWSLAMEGGRPVTEDIPVLFEVPVKRSHVKVTLLLLKWPIPLQSERPLLTLVFPSWIFLPSKRYSACLCQGLESIYFEVLE